MGFSRYFKSKVWELLFCAVAASALSYTVCSGFYATRPLQAYPLAIAGISIAITVVLFLIAYNARSAICGGIAFGAVVVAVVWLLAATGPGETPLDDVEGNYALFAIVVIASTLLVYLGSRTQVLTVVLLVVGVYASETMEYLYWGNHVAALLVFMVAGVALMLQKGYQRTVANTSAGRVSFAPIALSALAIGAVALLVGAGVYYFAIAPLDPPNQTVKLFTEYRRIDEIEVRGTGATTADQGGQSGNLAGGDSVESDESAADDPFDMVQSSFTEMVDNLQDQLGDTGAALQLFPPDLLALLAALLVAALFALPVLLKKLQRRMRYNRLVKPGGQEAAKNLYRFFLDRFRKLKLARPDEVSLSAYAAGFEQSFERFEAPSAERLGVSEGSAFSRLTDLYVRSVYGDERLNDDEVAAFVRYYDSFYRNACRYVGRPRYVFQFFRL